MLTDAEYVEALLEKWIPYVNGFENDPDLHLDRSYFMDHWRLDVNQELEWTGGRLVVAYLPVVDELGYLTILGHFEDDKLIYATALVDTDWSEFYRASYPVGLIDTTKPYTRKDEFLNTDS